MNKELEPKHTSNLIKAILDSEYYKQQAFEQQYSAIKHKENLKQLLAQPITASKIFIHPNL